MYTWGIRLSRRPDEVLKRAHEAGVRQAVTLGAGFDTRPWRLPLPGMHFFEVDLPGRLEAKVTLLGPSPGERVFKDHRQLWYFHARLPVAPD